MGSVTVTRWNRRLRVGALAEGAVVEAASKEVL